MQYLDTAPIVKDDLKQFLAATDDDFRLELKAYKVCKDAELDVSHGGTYEDYITRKTRQYDVRASIAKAQRTIHLAVECKHLKPFFPLLILQTPRTPEESYHEVMWSLWSADPITPGKTQAGKHRNEERRFYREGDFVGKVTHRVGRHSKTKEYVNDDSEVFDKWSQAVSSAHDLVEKSVQANVGTSEPFSFAITLPMLVVSDGAIWVAKYSEEGKQIGVPKRVDETTIYIGKQYQTKAGHPYSVSHLHIFTLTGFTKFVQRLTAKRDPNELIWYDLFPHKWISELASKPNSANSVSD